MTKITELGDSGYAGRNIAATATLRNHNPCKYLTPGKGLAGTFEYRTGDDVLLVTADGQSTISGPDFGYAFVAEIENHKHVRQRFTVGY